MSINNINNNNQLLTGGVAFNAPQVASEGNMNNLPAVIAGSDGQLRTFNPEQELPHDTVAKAARDLPQSVGQNLSDLGTALVSVGANLPELLGSGYNAVKNYVTTTPFTQQVSNASNYIFPEADFSRLIGNTRLPDGSVNDQLIRDVIADNIGGRNLINDIQNVIAGDYGLGATNFKDAIRYNIPIKDFLGNVAIQTLRHPLTAFLDFLGLKGTKGLRKALNLTDEAGNIEKAIATSRVEGAKLSEKARASLKAFNEIPDNLRAEVIKSAETGLWTKATKPYKETLATFSKDYDKLIPQWAKVDPERQAIIQRYVRQTGKTYQEAERELLPILEMTDEKSLKLLDEVAQVDDVAKFVKDSRKLYKEGDIFPVTHASGEADALAKTMGFISEADKFYGKLTERKFGLTPYEDIAKDLKLNNNELIAKQLTKYTDNKIANEILTSGTVGGYDVLPKTTKDTVYISKKLLEQGNLLKALENGVEYKNLKPSAKLDDLVAIDKTYANTLADQLAPLPKIFDGVLGDVYKVNKSVLLGTGNYLIGNAFGGGYNALVNSNVGLIDDIIKAIGTKGQLSKQLGIYRHAPLKDVYKTKAYETIAKANELSGAKLFRHIDRTIQNTFAEIAAHAEMRKAGIKGADRLTAMDNMKLEELGNLIIDTKRAAFITPTRSLVPRWLRPWTGATNPFYDWMFNNSLQSNYHMLIKNPFISNVLVQDILGKSGLDYEMKNRYEIEQKLGLSAHLDKPLVSYKIDNKTGTLKEISNEIFVPVTSIKLLRTPFEIANGDIPENVKTNQLLLGELVNSLQGKNKYDRKARSYGVSYAQDRRFTQVKDNNSPTGKSWKEHPAGTIGEIGAAGARSHLSIFNMVNNVLAPNGADLASNITGRDINYYRPYDNALFGTFGERGGAAPNPNFIIGGDPMRPVDKNDSRIKWSGNYSRDYYQDKLNAPLPTELKQLLRYGVQYGTLRND